MIPSIYSPVLTKALKIEKINLFKNKIIGKYKKIGKLLSSNI